LNLGVLIFIFSVFLFSSCEKELSFENTGGAIGGTAVFSVDGGSGNCTGVSINGSYVTGVATGPSNTATLSVNVTTIGTYTITSNTINGIVFSGAGTFNATGVQNITLTTSGTPLTAGSFNFTTGSGGCIFSVTVTSGSGGSGGTAAFTYAGGTGNCTGALLEGTYTAGTALTAGNTVKIQVNVDTIGTYTISTALLNGIQFNASGTFTNKGVQDIILTGTGTPTLAGDFSFKPGLATCSFNVTFLAAQTTEATYSFNATNGTCAGAVVNGTYTTGIATTASNTVLLKVNVTVAGTYSVTTGAVNGITFSATGSFTTTGANDLILVSTGIPAAPGNFNFKTGTSGCEFSVTIVPAVSPATYTLSGSPGSCTGAILAGIFKTSNPLSATNTVTIKVNVTAIGSYNLTTNNVNGFKFSKSGTFNTTGNQDVILTGTGTPLLAGTFTFTPSEGGNGCTFDVIVEQTPIDAGIYSCKIDGVLFDFKDLAKAENIDQFLNSPYLFLEGRAVSINGNGNGNDYNVFQIFITKNNNSAIGTGTYNETSYLLPNGYKIEIDFKEIQQDLSTIIWNTGSNFLTPNPPFVIIITSVTSTRVKGTFSGKLKDTLHPSNTTIRTVTEGTFDLPIQ
jgi:hypothetical protein